MKYLSSIETLECRIAPATLVPGNKSILTYTDVDGDKVTLSIINSTGEKFIELDKVVTFDSPFGTEGEQQLQLIDLSNFPEKSGTNITLTVTKATGGDGFANVGEIRANGLDLGVVKIAGDLGQINAGDNNEAQVVPGVKALKVQSLGRLGATTQMAGGDTSSSVKGGVGALVTKGDFHGEFNVLNSTTGDGKIGAITIGGSLLGGAQDYSGGIFAASNIGAVKIAGDIAGSSGLSSGQISAGGKIKSVTLGGSLRGGSAAANEAAFGSGTILSGTAAEGVDGSIGAIKIGGEIRGGDGGYSGAIRAGSSVGSEALVKSVSVKKGIIGGDGFLSGSVVSFGTLDQLTVGGDVRGGDGTSSAYILALGGITTAKIGGSLEGGDGFGSCFLGGGDYLTSVSIGGSIRSGHTGLGSLIATDGVLGNLTVGGSLIAGAGTNSDFFVSANSIGSIHVKGSIIGTATDRVQIAATGSGEPGLTLGSLKVDGDFINANLLTGGEVNPGTQVGAITIGGDFVASRIALSTTAGGDGAVGTSDDKSLEPENGVISRIASLTIKGQALGTFGGNDSFRIIAGEFGAVKIAGSTVPFTEVGPGDFDKFVGPSGDLAIRYGVPLPA
jgi:hypothetical protein